MLKKYIHCLIIFLCTCCVYDRWGYYKYYLSNESDYTFCIGMKSVDTLIVKIVNSKTTIVIDSFRTNNGLWDYEDDSFLKEFYDTLYVGCNDSIFVAKDLMKRKTWEYSSEEEPHLSNNYKLTITNSDVELRNILRKK